MSNNPLDFETDADGRRRDFLRRAALLSGAAGLLNLPVWSRNALAAINSGHVGGQYALELDGQFADYIKSFEGGIARGEPITTAVGAQNTLKKQVGRAIFDEFQVQFGSTSGPLIQWVAGILDGRTVSRSGAILTLDQNFTERRRTSFTNALPTELTIPALDASGGGAPGLLAVKLQPERTSIPVSKGGTARVGGAGRQERGWMKSNFQLKIAGLEQACSFVTRIEPLTVRQTLATNAFGEARNRETTAVKVEYSNLVIHVPEHQADPFFKWLDEFVIRGDNGDAKEKTGSLEFLGPNMRDVLMRFNFSNLGLLGCRHEAKTGEGQPQVRIEMYFEAMSMDMTVAKGAAAGPVKREVGGGSGSVGMDVLKGFNQ
jgi:hypothetical protein